MGPGVCGIPVTCKDRALSLGLKEESVNDRGLEWLGDRWRIKAVKSRAPRKKAHRKQSQSTSECSTADGKARRADDAVGSLKLTGVFTEA